MGSPLVIGKGKDENIVASDLAAIISHTDQVIYLNEGDIADVYRNDVQIESRDAGVVTPEIERVTWTLEEIERGGYDRFMLKEIYEQPVILKDTIRGRLNYDDGIARLNGIANYIEELSEAYNHFFFRYNNTPLLIVNSTDIDFVKSDEDFDELFKQIFREDRGIKESSASLFSSGYQSVFRSG